MVILNNNDNICINLDELTEPEKLDLINMVEFDYEKLKNGKYKLIDKLGANINSIEDDEYDDPNGLIERLDIYWDDYGIKFIQ